MTMLKAATIRGFKSIRDQRIEFGRLNVFIGANGAGKSNILEALGLLSAAASGEVTFPRLKERGVRRSPADRYRSSFRDADRSEGISLAAELPGLRYEATLDTVAEASSDNPWSFKRETVHENAVGGADSEEVSHRSGEAVTIPGLEANSAPIRPHQGLLARLDALGRLKGETLAALDCFRGYAIYAPATPFLRGLVEDESRSGTLGLYGGGLQETWHDIAMGEHTIPGEEHCFLCDCFLHSMDWLNSIGSIPNIGHQHEGVVRANMKFTQVVFTDRYMSGPFLSASDISEGALYLLFVLTLLCHPNRPRMIALDNVDHYLNPGAAQKLMFQIGAVLRRYPERQVFFTTHSPTALDAVDLFDDDQRLFVVERGKDGGTEVRRIQPPAGTTREQWEEKYGYMKLSEIWLSGAIGGLPEGF